MGKIKQRIEWTERVGTHCAVESDWCDTHREAFDQAIDSARTCGWTPPRWWEWWRWGDTRIQEPTE